MAVECRYRGRVIGWLVAAQKSPKVYYVKRDDSWESGLTVTNGDYVLVVP